MLRKGEGKIMLPYPESAGNKPGAPPVAGEGTMKWEISGGRVNYYLVKVSHPQREEQPPYQAECEDIMDALNLTPDEANIFKEIWRTANARQGSGKHGNTPLRAAEKIVHYAGRILRKAKRVL